MLRELFKARTGEAERIVVSWAVLFIFQNANLAVRCFVSSMLARNVRLKRVGPVFCKFSGALGEANVENNVLLAQIEF